MNRISVVYAVVIVMCATGLCHADTLMITYSSGKTQAVVLDESSQRISSWKFIGGSAQPEQIQKIPDFQPEGGNKPSEKIPDKKSGVRIKWNAKPIPD